MARFLVNWLNRALDRGSPANRSGSVPRAAASIQASSSDERRRKLAALSQKGVA